MKVPLSVALLCTVIISSCFAADFYLNPSANCTPPTGCMFNSNSTWLGDVVPSHSSDHVYITSSSSSSNETLIIFKDVPVSDDSGGILRLGSITLQNVVVVFDWSWLEVAGGLIINSSEVYLRNNTELSANVGGVIDIFNSKISVSDSYLGATTAARAVSSNFTLEDSTAVILFYNGVVTGGSFYSSNSSDLSGLQFYGTTVFDDVDLAVNLASFERVVFQSGTHYQIDKLYAETATLWPGVQVNTTYTVSISVNITLDAGSVLYFNNVTWASVNLVYAGGPGQATIVVDSSEVCIGGRQQSDLSNVILTVHGSSLVHAHHLLLGEVTTDSSAYLTLDVYTPVVFAKDVNLNGNVEISEFGNMIVNENVTVILSDCIYSLAHATIYGQLTCSSELYEVGTNALTSVYGVLIAPLGIVINNGSVLSLYSGAIFSSNIIINGSSVLSLSEGGFIISTGGSVIVDGSSVLQISNGSNYMLSNTIIKSSSTFNVDSVKDSLFIQGDLTIENSAIDVVLNKHVVQNSTFIIQVEGSVLIHEGQLQVIGNKDDAPETATQYNLVNSSTPINGSLPTPRTVASDDIGSVQLKQPSNNQILFEFTPKVASKGWPVWAYVLIGLGGALVLGLVVFFSYRLIKRRRYEPVE